jgi:hypothetical protein
MIPEQELLIARAKWKAFLFDLRGRGFLLRMHERRLCRSRLSIMAAFERRNLMAENLRKIREECTEITSE